MITMTLNGTPVKLWVRYMDAQHIVHAIRGVQDLEEAAGAYKDIDEVMEQQADLVKIKTRLFPIAVIKGN